MVDPGLGVGKSLGDNLALVNGLATFQGLGVPLLFAGSRKRLIGALSNEAPAAERLGGSVAMAFRAAELGAQMVRVNDVAESVKATHRWRGLAARSEERRVGLESVSTCRSGWSPCHSNK